MPWGILPIDKAFFLSLSPNEAEPSFFQIVPAVE